MCRYLHVVVGDGHAEDVLVEGPGEVGVQQLLVTQGLADDATDELEVRQVVRVDGAQGVGLRDTRKRQTTGRGEEVSHSWGGRDKAVVLKRP